MLTLDQATLELHANDRQVAQMIRAQSETNVQAQALINDYSTAVAGVPQGSPEGVAAMNRFLPLYMQWRLAHAAIVWPIAQNLGHELPAGDWSTGATPLAPAAAAAPELPADPFAGAPSTPTAPVPPTPPAAPPAAPTTPVAPASQASGDRKRTRTAFAHGDVVKLTKMLAPAPVEAHEQLMAAFAQASEGKFDLDFVRSKAIELELTPAPAAPPPVAGISDEDKRSIYDALIEWVAPEEFPRDVRLLRLKAASESIREIVKTIG